MYNTSIEENVFSDRLRKQESEKDVSSVIFILKSC